MKHSLTHSQTDKPDNKLNHLLTMDTHLCVRGFYAQCCTSSPHPVWKLRFCAEVQHFMMTWLHCCAVCQSGGHTHSHLTHLSLWASEYMRKGNYMSVCHDVMTWWGEVALSLSLTRRGKSTRTVSSNIHNLTCLHTFSLAQWRTHSLTHSHVVTEWRTHLLTDSLTWSAGKTHSRS